MLKNNKNKPVSLAGELANLLTFRTNLTNFLLYKGPKVYFFPLTLQSSSLIKEETKHTEQTLFSIGHMWLKKLSHLSCLLTL